MIRRLRLSNFRRHENTDLVFDEADQVIAITGRNGAGKSTVLEALTFAFYGESRHGRRNLAGLVRRGAELEGMEVEVEFDVDNTTYRVVRRKDGRASSAVLFANDNPVVEGPVQVTATIAGLFGMDSAGFRLAVVANQRELDGLVRLGGPARSRMVARLLRLDAVTRAEHEARARFRTAEAALKALPAVGDVAVADATVSALEADLASCQAAEADCRAAIANLEADLAGSAGIEEAYHEARRRLASVEGALATTQAEVERITAELNAVKIPEVPTTVLDDDTLARIGLDGNLDQGVLNAMSTELERSIARGEAAREHNEHRTMIARELSESAGRLDEVNRLLAGLGDGAVGWAHRSDRASVEADEHRRAASIAAARRDELLTEHAAAAAQVKALKERLAAIRTLGASCDRCGQAIPDEHRHSQEDDTAAQLAATEETLAGLVEQGRSIAEEMRASEEAAVAADRAREEADRNMRAAAALEGEATELGRRIEVYTEQLGRPEVSADDLEALYARKGDLSVVAGMLAALDEARAAREAALGRIADLQLNSAAAAGRVEAAQAAVEAAKVDAALEADYELRRQTADAHRVELAFAAELAAATADCEARLGAARATAQHTRELAEARAGTQDTAVVAAAAARLLDDVERRLTSQLRPTLEGVVSDKLTTLSAGRFTSVKLTSDYAVTVLEDGDWRPLAEFSGGETDLIALALRLGLAEVVADRANGSVGFLVLDEVLGSLDEERRQLVVDTLRGLRSTYGQVLAISHVPGLEDVADRVVDITVDAETGIAGAS